ncbi:MAG: glycosyltransferase family 2 protein [Ruminococcus sp.]|nr:glycosyltransferase family 2 protein [Ruminococcus sp.]
MKATENRILLSFILPIYNVEKYLGECIDSILSQITDECEIILVDDGSLDSSGMICEQYVQKDQRIKMVKKENGGLSSARNSGLEIATGRYVTFVDSDDKIASDSVKGILKWIKSGGTDMCFLKAHKFYSDTEYEYIGECLERAKLLNQSRESAIYHIASRPKYPGSAWAKLFRREFLIDNDLHFPYDRRLSEDLGFIRDCVLLSKDFDYLDFPYYHYRQNRQGSITNKITVRNFLDLSKFVVESADKLTVNKKTNEAVNQYMMSCVAYEYSILLYLYNLIPSDDKKDVMSLLKKYKWTLKYSLTLRGKILSVLANVFGLRFTALLVNAYRKAN